MKTNTCLVIDTWEGQLEIDEAVLKANGVAGMGIRLNDMNGGHHKDTGFEKQWAEAAKFVRFPYFVYNPWVDGKANFDWLILNLPNGYECKSVAIDIEVAYAGYPPETYAGEVNKFLALCQAQLKTIIYTAQWFLPYLSKWPVMDYWWAQYPDPATYFGSVKTWDDLKLALDKLDKPFNANLCPGTVKMWQFSGDYLVLPGNTRKMDVNIFYGTEQELADYFGNTTGDTTGPEVTEPDVEITAVKTTAGIVPELLSIEYTINGALYSQFLDQRPVVVPPEPEPIPEPTPTPPPADTGVWMRVKDDIETFAEGLTIRPYLRIGLPATVRYRGVNGNVSLPDNWFNYWMALNPDPAVQKYLVKDGSGWHNSGAQNNVVQITFSGNVVHGTVKDGKLYLDHYTTNETPPAPVRPSILSFSHYVQFFTAQYSNYLDMSCDGRYPLTFIICNPGEVPYIDLAEVAPYTPIDRIVTVSTPLNVRANPMVGTKIIKVLPAGAKATIYGTAENTGDIWGRLDLGSWIALRYRGTYYTDYRP